jgi:hypothetical protein
MKRLTENKYGLWDGLDGYFSSPACSLGCETGNTVLASANRKTPSRLRGACKLELLLGASAFEGLRSTDGAVSVWRHAREHRLYKA